jgi:hypothetical protein
MPLKLPRKAQRLGQQYDAYVTMTRGCRHLCLEICRTIEGRRVVCFLYRCGWMAGAVRGAAVAWAPGWRRRKFWGFGPFDYTE